MKKNEKCNCNNPHRNYGEKVCLNCGKMLDFESGKLYVFKGEEE